MPTPGALSARLVERRLIVMRHAKSDWAGAATDFDRPLAARGQQDAPKVGRWLKAGHLKPDYLISSPARRATETIEGVVGELGCPTSMISWDKRIYEADLQTLLAVIAEIPGTARCSLLVGHNPGLTALVGYLAPLAGLATQDKIMPTAGIAVLGMPPDWQHLARHCALLMDHTRPRWL